MPKFGRSSRARLTTCDKRLQKVFNEVIKHVDCSVLEGHRSGERQDKLFEEGKTKVKFPNGRHNSSPSNAVDNGTTSASTSAVLEIVVAYTGID